MNNLMFSTIVGTAAGIIGTGLGGACAFLLNNPSKRYISTILSFSAGLMIAVVCFDLLPRSFEIGGLANGLIGTIIGILAIAFFQEVISNRHHNKDKRYKQKNYIQTGMLLGVGIALHNFPEGLAIGTGFSTVQTFGIGLSLIIALHDIPEGVAMATPMRMGGMKRSFVILAAFVAGVPTGIGALIGYLLGEISLVFISLCLGFAGGAMLYITCSELIPESRDLYKGRISSMGLILGIIVGIIISQLF